MPGRSVPERAPRADPSAEQTPRAEARPSAAEQAPAAERGASFDRRDPRLAVLIVLGGWLLVEAAVLSLSKGIVHPYYVSALGPGVRPRWSAPARYAFARFAGRRDWRLLLRAGAAAATVPAQLVLLHRDHYMSWFIRAADRRRRSPRCCSSAARARADPAPLRARRDRAACSACC